MKSNILAIQREQKKLRREVKKIKKSIPINLIGIAFFSFLIIFGLESKVYHFFGGGVNFIKIGIIFTLFICILYVFFGFKKIKYKEKLLKSISTKLYRLMKLNNE